MDAYYIDELIKIGLAFVVGAAVGIERELRSKPAGFRTMIMICVGSCLFTILSKEVTDISPDRIASNIVTGIGFIGAGVIFKEGMSINGLTTAALIWVTAALGMAAGYGNFLMVGIVSALVLFTLFVLELLQRTVERVHKVTVYKIKYLHEEYSQETLENYFKEFGLRYHLMNVAKDKEAVAVTYRLVSNDKKYKALNGYLMENDYIKSFTV
jgi:putative Mg2+ transporter-C (MgtC) family protein